MKRSSTEKSFAAALALVALLATACSGSGESSGSTATPPGSKPRPSATSNQINPVPRDRVQDGGTFTWPLDQMPANFNYNELDGTSNDGFYVISALIPSMYTNDAAATPVWSRDYLASEPTLVTEPKQIVTYEINPKAIWYDGTPITWEDFFWQWKASSGKDKAYQIAGSNGYEDIESVQKGKDEREVIVTFKNKFSDWPNTFSLMYPVSTNKNPRVFNEGWKEHLPTTAGPFRLDSIDATAKTITLVRNEKWWGDRAKLDKIVYRVIEPDAQIDAVANGEIDAMDIGADANKFNRAKNIAGAELRIAGGPNFVHLTINGTSPVLQDINVRRALAMGIDRAVIARALLGPLGLDVQTLGNHIFMANQNGYQDNSGEVGKYDPERARQLLDAAGWKLDGSVRKKDGKPLEITFIIPGGVATSKQMAELVQNSLGQIGVTVKISSAPMNDFFAKYVTTGQFEFTVFSWIGTAYPISSAKSIYAKPKQDSKGEMDIQQNYARIGSEEIDATFNQANQELDQKKAIELANKADALIWQEVHSLTIYQRPELVVSKKTLVNFGAFGFALPWVYQDIGWAKQ